MKKTIYGDWGLGIGDWGLGIGDWGLGPIPHPQSPIPNKVKEFFILLNLNIINYLFLDKSIFLNKTLSIRYN